ncbi:hypothetical protein Esti_005910 [Eimeria stiedai]
MGADGGNAPAVLRHKEPAVTSSKETSSSNCSSSSKGALDVCSSISEYLLQLHAAAPSINPVPCGSFFTAHTTLADLTGSGSSNNSWSSSCSSSSIARDLFAAVTQRPAEGDPKAFKTFAKNFHEAAVRRLAAAAKSCSVCGAWQQQEDGGSGEEWGLCLLPHLNPAKRLKSFPFPEASLLVAASHAAAAVVVAAVAAIFAVAARVQLTWPALILLLLLLLQLACGRCLGVLRLSGLLASATANVLGDSSSSATVDAGPSAAALKHFIAVNANGKGPQGPILYSRSGCSSTNSKGLQQQPAARKRDSSQQMQSSTEAQQRALDVSLAAAFATQLLSKEVPWRLRGPTDTLQQLLACLVRTSSAAAASSTFGGTSLRPVKSEPQEGAAEQQRKLQREKQSKSGNNSNSRENESSLPCITEGPIAANRKPLKTDACNQHQQHQRGKKSQKQQTPKTRKKLQVA